MDKYTIVNFQPLRVLMLIHCNSEEELTEGLKKLAELAREPVPLEFKDLYPHSLHNGTMYQVMVGPN